MKLQFLFGFLLVTFLGSAAATLVDDAQQLEDDMKAKLPHQGMLEEKPQQQQQQRLRHRNLNSSSKSNSGDVSKLIETHPCIPFDQIHPDQINDPWGNADETCATNSCGGGCCRAYNWLLCDESNDYVYVACVCNENTQDPNNFVPDEIPPP